MGQFQAAELTGHDTRAGVGDKRGDPMPVDRWSTSPRGHIGALAQQISMLEGLGCL